MGIKLDAAFRAAGLAAPSMHLEAVVGGTKAASTGHTRAIELVVTMLSEI